LLDFTLTAQLTEVAIPESYPLSGGCGVQRGGTVRAWLDYHWPGYAPAPLTPPRPALPRYQ
jgi:hypothetical protein